MSRSKIDVANEALAHVGAARIAAFDDGSAEGEQVSRHYESVVGTALLTPGGAPFRWSWATRQDRLTRLDETPQARWAYAYQAPLDLLRLHAVTRGGHPIAYTVHRDNILCDEDGGLVADYTMRVDEDGWPPDFAAAVALELATRLAVGLNENADLAGTLAKMLDWRGVRTADSQARTSPRLRATRLTAARFGGRPRW
jgi:hypothetical protein